MQSRFSRRAQDHARVQVHVTPVASVSGECFSRTLTELRSLCPVPVKLPSVSQHKKLDLHFNPYNLLDERSSNGWGEFQYHRRLMAVIGVAECEMLDDMNDIESEMARIEKDSQTSLLDWRCIVYIRNRELEGAVSGGGKGRFHCVVVSDGSVSCALEGFLEDVASYLYLAIDSRRHECSEMKPEKIPLLTCPLDKKEMTEEEGKQARRRCQSRLNKHLGDLCLLLGQHESAFKYYSTAADQLKAANDLLWMAGALEGQCAASINVSHPAMKENSEGEEQTSEVRRKGKRQLTLKRNSQKSPSRKSPSELMSDSDIVLMYDRALAEYSKFRDAWLVEMDCRLCCVRHLTTIKRVRVAADVLQEMVYVKVLLTEEERVELFQVMGDLFHDLGYHRKSCFYCRLAAMHSVAFKMTRPDWNKAYSLLLRSLEELEIDVNDTKPIARGWPIVHDRLLHEITYVAKKLDKDQLALSHSLRHLGSLYEHLSESDLKGLTAGIDVLVKLIAKDCVASPDSTTLMPLTSIPTVRSLAPRNLPSQLQPFAVNHVKSDSVFIFSSLKKNLKKQEPTVFWVQNAAAEVVVEVSNPLPFEIKVEKLFLLTEGVKFETGPFSVALPAKSDVNQFPLVGTPLECGELKIRGYAAKVFGVESHVNFPCNHVIKVTPPLPRLHFSLVQPHLTAGVDGLVGGKQAGSPDSSPQTSQRVQNKGKTICHLGSLHIMDGQQLEVLVKMENRGVELVKQVDMSMTIPDTDCSGLISWTIIDIKKYLPLERQKSAHILITVHAHYPQDELPAKHETSDGPLVRDNSMARSKFEDIQLTERKPKGTSSPLARAKRIFKRSMRTMSVPNRSPVMDRDLSDPEASPKRKGKRGFLQKHGVRRKDDSRSSSSDPSKSSETTPSPETTLRHSLVLDWEEMPHPRLCSVEVTFRYGHLECGEVSLYRESHCVVEFLVQPVVKVTGFNVEPSRRRQTMAKLSLEVQNICSLPIEVSCSVGGSGLGTTWYTLTPLRQCSVSAHIKRCHLGRNADASSALDRWSVWLRENIRIEWLGPGSTVKGSLPLPNVSLTNWHLQSLQPDPLQIRCYYVDGDREVPNGGVVEAYNPVEIFTKFHNTSDACVGPFTFELQSKSTAEVMKGDEIGWIGPINGRIGQLNPDEKHLHTSCVVFSEGGEYEVQVKCRPSAKSAEGPGRQPSFHAAVLQITVEEP